jgi:hypothetical protein
VVEKGWLWSFAGDISTEGLVRVPRPAPPAYLNQLGFLSQDSFKKLGAYSSLQLIMI